MQLPPNPQMGDRRSSKMCEIVEPQCFILWIRVLFITANFVKFVNFVINFNIAAILSMRRQKQFKQPPMYVCLPTVCGSSWLFKNKINYEKRIYICYPQKEKQKNNKSKSRRQQHTKYVHTSKDNKKLHKFAHHLVKISKYIHGKYAN